MTPDPYDDFNFFPDYPLIEVEQEEIISDEVLEE